ncbi:MAG: hypothetical protein LBK25_08215 [Treponema sp.]|jgi:hypothetical protein|nr:hypothetical protein [Treponema sp.]
MKTSSIEWEDLAGMRDGLEGVYDQVADLRFRNMKAFNGGRSHMDTRASRLLYRALEGLDTCRAYLLEAYATHDEMGDVMILYAEELRMTVLGLKWNLERLDRVIKKEFDE